VKWHKRFAKSMLDAIERSQRTRVLYILSAMDPSFLKEMGYSLELLHEGVSSWPWRSEAVDGPPRAPSNEEIWIVQATGSERTDAERADSDTSKYGIPKLIRYSRPEIDNIAA